METFDKRLARLKDNPPVEYIQTILISLSNFFIPELTMASEHQMSHLLILGIHSVIETISEKIFLRCGLDGFKFYLENFVDFDEDGFRFTEIADELNDWRNVLAHQFISKIGHRMRYDYSIQQGFQIDNDDIIINPTRYFDQFKDAFRYEGRTRKVIWNYDKMLTKEEMERAKEKFIKTFEKR